MSSAIPYSVQAFYKTNFNLKDSRNQFSITVTQIIRLSNIQTKSHLKKTSKKKKKNL